MRARWLIFAAVTLGVGVLAPSAIAAEPMSTVGFSMSPEPVVGQPVSITVSGTSSQAGELAVYMLSSAPVGPEGRCPAVQSKEGVVLSNLAPPTPVSAGSYSQTYSFTPNSAGTYVACGYLYDPSTEAIYAEGTGSFNATVHSEIAPSGTTGNMGSATAPSSTAPEPPSKPASPPPHLTTLTVKAHDHPGSTAAKPGKTELLIGVTPDAHLRLVLNRYGHKLTVPLSFGAKSSGKYIVHWTCSKSGGVYHYTVTATDSYGKTLTRHGKFHPVSAARCGALKVADARRLREEEAARSREGHKEAPAAPEGEVQEAEKDQSNFCESGLEGLYASGHVLEQNPDNGAPETGREVETVCVAGGRYYFLHGDYPITVTGGGSASLPL